MSVSIFQIFLLYEFSVFLKLCRVSSWFSSFQTTCCSCFPSNFSYFCSFCSIKLKFSWIVSNIVSSRVFSAFFIFSFLASSCSFKFEQMRSRGRQFSTSEICFSFRARICSVFIDLGLSGSCSPDEELSSSSSRLYTGIFGLFRILAT